MTRNRLITLFTAASLVSIAAFTAVVYHGHVKSANKRDFNDLGFYTQQLNEKRRLKIKDSDKLPPYHVLEKNAYQVIVSDNKGKTEFLLKTHPWYRILQDQFPFEQTFQSASTEGHIHLDNKEFHWIKHDLRYPDGSIMYIHPEMDHWAEFNNTFGTAITILGFLTIWAAVWAALILSNLFKRVHDKNQLLQQQAVEICNARDAAYEASRAKSRFLANISHELRTPLTAILGFSENMLDEDNSCRTQTMPLETIIRNGNHLLHIINDLLDLSKIEEDKLRIERIEFSPVQLLQDVELLMQQQAEDKGLELKVNYSWPLPEAIKNDPFRLKQVLINLVSNAIKFTDSGYVHINVRCQRNADQLHIEVIDTGIGISHELHKEIFQPFNQADISITRKYGGTGLGLSLTKHLIELMGGSIELISEPGKGSRFSFSIPTSPLNSVEFINNLDKHRIPTTGDVEPEIIPLKGHVLAADDAPDNQLLLSALLGKFGLQVTIVENGQIALDMIRDKKDEYDLVLLDIQMPVLNGLDTIEKLKQMNYSKPVIALTANTLKEDRDTYEQAGFTDYIAKPIRFRILNRILASYLPSPN